MKTIYMFLTMAVALSAAGTTQTFTGVITDTMCGAKHGMTGRAYLQTIGAVRQVRRRGL